MSLFFRCNECSEELPQPPDIKTVTVQFAGVNIRDNKGVRQMQNADFCSLECMKSFFVKAANKPVLLVPHG